MDLAGKDLLWLEHILDSNRKRDEILKQVCEYLANENAHFDWVGFYIAHSSVKELDLGPFVGAPTEHVRIPFGRGVCGRAAESLTTIVVRDVSGEANYLACSLDVKSEIVVPVFNNGRFVAELDIDSHKKYAFTDLDRQYLEAICRKIGGLF